MTEERAWCSCNYRWHGHRCIFHEQVTTGFTGSSVHHRCICSATVMVPVKQSGFPGSK